MSPRSSMPTLITNTMVLAEVDAYNACWMRARDLGCIVTFDRRHMSRFDGISVCLPGAD